MVRPQVRRLEVDVEHRVPLLAGREQLRAAGRAPVGDAVRHEVVRLPPDAARLLVAQGREVDPAEHRARVDIDAGDLCV